jgi:hypothetical protein
MEGGGVGAQHTYCGTLHHVLPFEMIPVRMCSPVPGALVFECEQKKLQLHNGASAASLYALVRSLGASRDSNRYTLLLRCMATRRSDVRCTSLWCQDS